MWNDKETNVDLLGHRRIAQTIVEILREEELRPLTIGIHGSWGAGKTSILSLIEAELKDDETALCLTFNGWLYQGYDDTKSALMEAVVHALLSRRSA
ncbi:MAG: NTPase KAP, partial [Hymenobacter sp.]